VPGVKNDIDQVDTVHAFRACLRG